MNIENFNYADLYYIQLDVAGSGSKNPPRSWGGYGQDFDESDSVYTHADLEMIPNREWGIVGIDDNVDNASVSLLTFDLDVHKAPEDFDPADVQLPSDTAIVKSQNGGLHVYFAVHEPKGMGAESDFEMTHDLGWDIDIRGSFVQMHTVAPSDIPNVGGDYELVNDEPIKTVFDPADAAERIQYKGEPLLEYNPATRSRSGGSSYTYDPDTEPPEDMPKCYHAALELRKENADDHPNTHKVNLLAALCGLASGYDTETVVNHFVDDYAPGNNADRAETEYQVDHIARNLENDRYSPPSIQTLRDYRILGDDETCNCDLPYHGGDNGDGLDYQELWEWWSEGRKGGNIGQTSVIPEGALAHVAREYTTYDMDALESAVDEIEELPAAAHNKALYWVQEIWADEIDLGDDVDATARDYRDRDPSAAFTWQDVRYIYEESKERGRQAAENLLRGRYHFITVNEELHVYDEQTGMFTDLLASIRGEIHDGLGEHWSTHELNEILARLRQKNIVEPRELNGREQFDDPHICVNNGVLNLFTRELHPHSPEYKFVDRVPITHDPDAPTDPIESFVSDVTEREADAKAMLEMVGHALIPDANERYKKFLMLYGDADNGKSLFYSLVKSLLQGPNGEEKNVASVKLDKLTSNQFATNSVYGNMANIAGEINGKKIRNTAHLKDITGGDQVEIEPKGADSFFDTINATLMFAANDPPLIGERDKEAIAKRIVPVELPFTFTDDPKGPLEKEKIPERKLKDDLTSPEALSGFLNLALDGIERLEENEGDVSLPESPMDRLEKYEANADPMKEFGKECLENAEGDYVVKGDVTTLYQQWADENDYELGSSYGTQLHKVLRGIQGFNYSTSYKRSPDYSGTGLPLQAWNDRKTVINRATLTEKGLEYARHAGMVDEPDDDEETAETETLTPIGSIEVGRQRSFTATVAAVSDGEYNREAQGTLKGPHGTYIGFVVPGGNSNPLEGKQGETFRFENVTVRTDEDGLREAVVNDAAAVVETESGQQAGLDNDGTQAATDGGEIDQPKGKVARHVSKEIKSGAVVTVAELAGKLEMEPPKVESALDSLAQQGVVSDTGDGYEVM